MNKRQLLQNSIARLTNRLLQAEAHLSKVHPYTLYGSLISALGTTIEAHIPTAKIGDLCQISDPAAEIDLTAEVMAIHGDRVRLLPYGSIENISQTCKFRRLEFGFKINVGDFLLGKIVDGFGRVSGSLNGEPYIVNKLSPFEGELRSIHQLAPDPYQRPIINEKLVTGVTSIDLFTTCGIGQRIGIFAGPGLGKTTLMGMIIRNSKVDVVVTALVGERGREVREFIDLELDQASYTRTVVVTATSDRPAVEQLKCAYVAQTIAEYFRDQGKNVLLMLDSVTRFARAGREVGLSSGEPLTRGGFPPSVFLSFPKLMERAGKTPKGSITAFYTILMEAEDVHQDAIADEVKSILDGHIILRRKLAEQGQFPAVDILKSLSRLADRIIDQPQLVAARHLRLLLSKYEELEFLIRVGEYKAGHDPLSDEAVAKFNLIIQLLKQNHNVVSDFNKVCEQMINIAEKRTIANQQINTPLIQQ